MIVKLYGADRQGGEAHYTPADCIGCRAIRVGGRLDPKDISTGFVRRQNLTMRMNMPRSTRLTNAFSKKIENHAATVALHYMYYNFWRIPQTLRVTPR